MILQITDTEQIQIVEIGDLLAGYWLTYVDSQGSWEGSHCQQSRDRLASSAVQPSGPLCPATNLTFRDFLLGLRWLPLQLLSAIVGVYTRAGAEAGWNKGQLQIRQKLSPPLLLLRFLRLMFNIQGAMGVTWVTFSNTFILTVYKTLHNTLIHVTYTFCIILWSWRPY